MSDGFSEVTSTGYFSRIGGSIKGVLAGVVIFVVAFPLLFTNEGCAVKRYKVLAEGRGAIVEVASDNVDPANEGNLVYLNGEASTDETLSDDKFGVSVSGIVLHRDAEMYQWNEKEASETKKTFGGGETTTTNYSYTQEWGSKLVNSGEFHKDGQASHRNPDSLPVSPNTTIADEVRLGAFRLSPTLVGQIEPKVEVPVTEELVATAAATFERKATRDGSWIYLGDDPKAPKIGDVRVKFKSAPSPQTVSMFAAQRKDSFSSWKTSKGKTLEQSLSMGNATPDEMFDRKESQQAMQTWILRGVGFFIMFLGVTLVLKPLSVLADVVPLFGNIVGVGTAIVAFLIAAPCALLTVAAAWLFYRPLIGIPLVVAAVALVVGLIVLLMKNRARSREAMPEPGT